MTAFPIQPGRFVARYERDAELEEELAVGSKVQKELPVIGAIGFDRLIEADGAHGWYGEVMVIAPSNSPHRGEVLSAKVAMVGWEFVGIAEIEYEAEIAAEGVGTRA